jgi:fucose permease
MRVLWPFFPLIAGIALLALGATGDKPGSALVIGIAAVVAAVVCFWAVRDSSDSRVLAPIVRLWPLVLVVAGVLIFNRAKKERLGASFGSAPDADAPDSVGKPDQPQSGA